MNAGAPAAFGKTRFGRLAGLVFLSLSLLAVPLARAQTATAEEALHVVNRLSLGPAPGEVARVMRIGVDRYIDEQLHPERLALSALSSSALNNAPAETQRAALERFQAARQAAKNEGETGKAERKATYRDFVETAAEARLQHALSSPRQLQEVMVDFWFNHFNVFADKGLVRAVLGDYERTAIRPHALGRFRDLLGATAHHPAMLFYLDNWQSSAPGWRPRGAPRWWSPHAGPRRTGPAGAQARHRRSPRPPGSPRRPRGPCGWRRPGWPGPGCAGG